MEKTLSYLLLILLSGCAHYGEWKSFTPIPKSGENSATLYFYNYCDKGEVIGSGNNIYIDGKRRAYIAQGSYYGTVIDSGDHKIEYNGMDTPKLTITIKIKPNQTMYFKIAQPYFISGDPYSGGVVEHAIAEVNPHIAEKEIIKCKWAKKSYFSSSDAL